MPSYHDLHITTVDIPRTSIFNLPFDMKVTCSRTGGWELWQGLALIAGEFDEKGLRLDVDGHVIVDSLVVRPANCRNRLRDEGKPYPRSGCGHCKTGGLTGCPFEGK